ncbi:MAG TPA: NAD(P)H-binding protein [Cellulomonas sp.]
MSLVVLGATGRTGQEVVRQGLDRGLDVTALVRRREGLPIEHDRLRVVVGDARDAAVIEDLLPGATGVVSSLGLPASGRSHAEIDDSRSVDVCLVSTELLLAAMPRHGVRNLYAMSTHGAGSSNDGSPYVRWLRDLVGNRVGDKDRMEELLAGYGAGEVRWTVGRNPAIYEGPRRPHAVHEHIVLDRSSRITYADLATFAIDEALEPRYTGKFLTITEPLLGDEHPA